MTDPRQARLQAAALNSGYGERTIIEDLDLAIPDGSFTVIIGPNGCGKSTLLRSLARLIRPTSGAVLLDGADIATSRTKQLARTIGLLPQSSIAPEGITVVDLVSRGRHPHQSVLRRWGEQDEAAVREALERTRLTELSTRVVDELSGGQRQRVWIAMALAQQTPLLLLDEPTTYLDISHQIDVLDLCTELHREGRTLVAVLHDLNQAARYATHLVALKQGRIIAQGTPSAVVTAELLHEVFGVQARIVPDPETGGPLIVPRAPAQPQTPIPTTIGGTP
ncbi:MAG: ABC transporter ATP-binding protein [Propionicimonas sp.]|uniref:ABC transporter ATP-binding protein n=1 Tax=Propionicimonas sp. TaxID=1955623 RepID=UPI002B1FA31F|nr:ABC transporter ATP-binding protein [Propionicimonas sp.]MEA4943691.1 ABC transporter ATP-binding protein [Propionicimonas sp.]